MSTDRSMVVPIKGLKRRFLAGFLPKQEHARTFGRNSSLPQPEAKMDLHRTSATLWEASC